MRTSGCVRSADRLVWFLNSRCWSPGPVSSGQRSEAGTAIAGEDQAAGDHPAAGELGQRPASGNHALYADSFALNSTRSQHTSGRAAPSS